MAKKTTTQTTLPASNFDGGLLGLIGTSLLALLALILWAAVAAGIVIGGHFLTPTVMQFVGGLQMDTNILEIVITVAFYAWYVIVGLIAFIPLSCGLAATTTITIRWTARHTVIGGKRLRFTGKAVQLFGNCVKWLFLTIITLGIYGLWVSIKYKKWEVKHTVFEDANGVAAQTPAYPALQTPSYTAQQPQYPAQNGYPMPIVLPPVYPPYAPTYPPVPPCGYNQNKQ